MTILSYVLISFGEETADSIEESLFDVTMQMVLGSYQLDQT